MTIFSLYIHLLSMTKRRQIVDIYRYIQTFIHGDCVSLQPCLLQKFWFKMLNNDLYILHFTSQINANQTTQQ